MNAAFVLGAGLLTMIGVVGVFATLRAYGGQVRRAVCAGLLCLSPLGLGLCGIYTIEDPLVHLVGFLLFVLTPLISFRSPHASSGECRAGVGSAPRCLWPYPSPSRCWPGSSSATTRRQSRWVRASPESPSVCC